MLISMTKFPKSGKVFYYSKFYAITMSTELKHFIQIGPKKDQINFSQKSHKKHHTPNPYL